MCTGVAKFTGVVPQPLLLFCTAAALLLWKFRESVGWNCPSLFRVACPHNTYTRTHRSTIRRRRYSIPATAVVMLWPPKCQRLNARHRHIAAADITTTTLKGKSTKSYLVNSTAVLEAVPGSYCGRILKRRNAHTRALTTPHAKAPFVSVTRGEMLEARPLNRGCLAFG